MSERRTVFRACNLCEAICGLELVVEDGRVVSVRGDEQDPLSRGHICPKGAQIARVHEDPDRLRTPLIREENTWREVTWPEALSFAAGRLAEIHGQFGPDAIAVYAGNPNVHNYGSLLFGSRLYSKLRTKNAYSATSVDQLPHHLASYLMFGHSFLLPVPDIDRTHYFLILGANPIASNGSMMTVPDVRARLKAIRTRGGRVVTVDPRRTETAALAEEHVFIRPGADALFLLGLLNVLCSGEPPARADRLLSFATGWDELRALTRGFEPEIVSGHTGVPVENIRRIAREFSESESAVAYGRVGLSTQEFGGLCQWLIQCLNIVTGNLDRPGGAMFTLPAADTAGGAYGQNRGSFDAYRSRVRGLPEFSGELPVAGLADEILTPGPGQVRALFTSAGNPVLSTPNGGRLDSALATLDFMVSVDIYLNETTRHAHVILPPTSMLEHEHYDIVFHALAVRNTARLSPAVFEKPEGALHDYEIFSDLARRLELAKAGKTLPGTVIPTRSGPRDILAHMLKNGPYGKTHGLSVEKLEESPHGVDLGPLQQVLPERLRTEDGRIQLCPPEFVRDLRRLQEKLQEGTTAHPEPNGKLLLIGRRELRSNNSWMHNIPKLMSGANRCTLQIHPDDARSRGIEQGGRVVVRSRTGEVILPAEVTSDVMAGVVSLPHGYGHHGRGTRLRVAEAHAGVSHNDLTDEQLIDGLTGNAAFSGLEVEVAPAAD